MKVVVIKEFIDTHTKAFHPVGEELEISKARYAEITKVGDFVRPVEETKPTRTKKKEVTADGNGDS